MLSPENDASTSLCISQWLGHQDLQERESKLLTGPHLVCRLFDHLRISFTSAGHIREAHLSLFDIFTVLTPDILLYRDYPAGS